MPPGRWQSSSVWKVFEMSKNGWKALALGGWWTNSQMEAGYRVVSITMRLRLTLPRRFPFWLGTSVHQALGHFE